MLDFSHPDVTYETLETYFVIELQKMLLESRTVGYRNSGECTDFKVRPKLDVAIYVRLRDFG